MRILIVEDDEKLSTFLRFHLGREGYTIDACTDGLDALHLAMQQAYDVILLDRMLPALDGIGVLRKLRTAGVFVPVLMLTALGGVEERVDGLDAGADDYLVKPFEIKELLARIRAMGRRPRRLEISRKINCLDFSFDCALKQLSGKKGSCSLSRREAALLETLARNAGNTLTRDVLLARVWGPDAAVENGSLDCYIHFLRAHIRAVGGKTRIKTVRGVGYRLEAGGDV